MPFRSSSLIRHSTEVIPTLEIRDLSGSGSGDDGIGLIMRVVTENKSLKVIDFDGLQPEKLESYAQLLHTFQTLPQLQASSTRKDFNR
jgi:hypothetical protein